VRQGRWRRGATATVCLAGLLLIGLATPAAAGASTTGPDYYLALGGSGSVGVQPTASDHHGQPTDEGYVNDLSESERSIWPNLRLVKLGCPGATTVTMIDGSHRCHYTSGSQLAEALAFLHDHRSTVLMTVDLGFNNVSHCMRHEQIDDPCVTDALRVVHDQLRQIVSSLRSAGDPHMHIVGVGHYDPYLGRYLDGGRARVFASASLPVIARLNETMRSAYAQDGVPMADVSGAFDVTDTASTALDNTRTVPRNVERICALTWMCAPPPYGPNPHPNAGGYKVISRSISDTLPHS
jgi:lysophospholipase L1-like esterase